MTDTKTERNPAGVALFKVEMMVLMLNSGRLEEAQTLYAQAITILTDLENELDGATV